jgi:hypothetical protein
MPIATTAAILGGASILGGILGSSSASKAAKAQAQAAQQSAQLQREMYQQTRSDLSPFRVAGQTALGNYGSLLGLGGPQAYGAALSVYKESPFLADLIGKTQKSVEAANAARGRLNSGGTTAELADRTNQLYLGDFNNYLSRLSGLSETGQNAAAQTGTFGANAAAQQGSALMAAGNARANGYINQANAWGNVLGQLGGIYGAYQGGAFGGGGGGFGGGFGK